MCYVAHDATGALYHQHNHKTKCEGASSQQVLTHPPHVRNMQTKPILWMLGVRHDG